MAPKRNESPPTGQECPPNREENPPEVGEGPPVTEEEIPAGWSVKSEVEMDGSTKTTYYCPDSGQEFYTYPDLIRYVCYAKERQIGIYRPYYKLIRNRDNDALKKPNPTGRRRTAALSIPGRPGSSKSSSLAVEPRMKTGALSIPGRPSSSKSYSLAVEPRMKTGALSIPGRPSSSKSYSLAVEQNDDSKSSSSGESTDEDEDEDYVPEQEADGLKSRRKRFKK